MKTKEIELTKGKVIIKELTFGDENNATRRALDQALLEGKNSIDLITKREFLLLESIIEAPFTKNVETMRSLSRTDGLRLTMAFNELNEVVPGESKPSEQVSSKESTQTENSEDGQKR